MDAKEYTISDYLLWLQGAIDGIDAIENQSVKDQEIRQKCGTIVRQSGMLATKLGLTHLYKKSIKEARNISPADDTPVCLSAPLDARIFLSECVKECRLARDESQAGTVQSATPTELKERNTVYEIAYDWYRRADAVLPGWVTNGGYSSRCAVLVDCVVRVSHSLFAGQMWIGSVTRLM